MECCEPFLTHLRLFLRHSYCFNLFALRHLCFVSWLFHDIRIFPEFERPIERHQGRRTRHGGDDDASQYSVSLSDPDVPANLDRDVVYHSKHQVSFSIS